MTVSLAEAPGSDIQRNVTVDLNADVSGYTQGMQAALQQTQALAGALGGVVQQADSLAKRAGKTLMHFSVGDFAALGTATGVAARFEHQLGVLNATAAITGSSMSQMKQQITGVFQQFPVWREQVVALAQAIGNLGVTRPSDIGKLTASYTKLGAATGEDSTSLAASGIQLAKQMGNLDAGRIDKYNNSLVTLAKTAGVSAQSITDFASALAPFAKQADIGEAAVLGISAAFQKAGADGLVAANAFNSILQSITQLKSTGGDLSKYSAFLGMTQGQFRAGSTGTEAIQILQQIAKGGPAATMFSQDIGGLRAQGAIQRVAQSGDLTSLVNLSQQSATNTNNLDKGAQAAFGGLTNSMTMLRNGFTELATIIGDPLLKPLTALVDVLGKAVSGIDSFLKMLGPVVPVAGAVAGAAALPAAFGLAHAGLATAVGTARYAFGRNAGWRQAFGAGREFAQNIQGGMDPFEAMGANEWSARAARGQLPYIANRAFMAGQSAGMGGGGAGRGLSANLTGAGGNWWQQILNSPFGMAVRTGWAQGRGMAPPVPPPAAGPGMPTFGGQLTDRLKASPGVLGNLAARVTAWGLESQIQPIQEAGVEPLKRAAYRQAAGEPVGPTGSPMGRIVQAGVKTPFAFSQGILDALAAGAGGIAGKMPEGGLGTAGEIAARGVQGVAKAGSLFTRAASTVASGVFSGPGLAIGAIGLPIAAAIADVIKRQLAAPKDVTQSLSSASRLDQELDSASSNLAQFSDSVNTAADTLAKFANTPLQQTATIGQEDIGAVQTGQVKVDQGLAAVAKQSGNDPRALLAWLNSQGVQAPDMMGDKGTQLKRQLLGAVGLGNTQTAQSVWSQFIAEQQAPGGFAGASNFDVIGQLAAGVSPSNNELFKTIIGAGFPGIQAGTKPAGEGGNLPKIADMIRLSAQGLQGTTLGQGDRIQTVLSDLQSYTGVSADDMQKAIQDAARKRGLIKSGPMGGAGSTPFNNLNDAIGVLTDAFAATQGGADYLKSVGLTGQQVAGGALTGLPFPGPSDTDTGMATLRGQGLLGQQLARTGVVSQYNAAPGNASMQQQAVNTTLNQALKVGSGLGDTSDQLRQMAVALGGSTSALGQMANAAADAADSLSSLEQLTETRAGAAKQAAVTSNRLRAELTPDSSPEQVQASQTADTNAQQQAGSLLQYSRGLIQQAKDATKQNQRAEQDYQTQVSQTNLAFYNQQTRAAEDYHRAVFRSQRDFETQSIRSTEDYNRQQARATEDFNTQQTRATADYERDRTREIEDANTQQARAEADYLRDRERAIDDFHTQASRAEADYLRDRNREIADYNTQQLRAEQDYQTSRSRQIADFNLSRTRELADFQTQQERATEDFNRQMARQAEQASMNVYDPWTRIQRKATTGAANLLRNLTKQNTSMAKQISELSQAKDLGVSDQTIQQLDLSNPANAQQLDALIKSLKRNPQLASQINSQITTRVADTKALTQNPYNLAYKNEVDDFNLQQKRASEDLNKNLARQNQDLTTSLTRSAADFAKSTSRSSQDLSKQLTRQAQDYATSTTRSAADFHKQMARGATDFATSTERASADLEKSLTRQATDFTTTMTRNVADFTKQLSRASEDFSTAQARAAADEKKTLGDMATDFSTTTQRAATDHQIALDQMATQYKTAQDRAGQDLLDSFTQYTSGFQSTVDQMTSWATGAMMQYAPDAARAFLSTISDIADAMGAMVSVPGVQDLFGGVTTGAPGGGGGGARTAQRRAAGAIALNPQHAIVGDAGPELVLPLNSHGEDFMASLIAKSLARGITMAIGTTGDASQSVANDNSISFAGADIQVVADDPNKMAKQLAHQAKIKRLTSPVRAH